MAESLKQRIREDLNAARRARDRLRTTVLSTTLSEVRNQEIEVGHDLADPEVVEVLGRAVKKRREAADQMRAGGREELASGEEREAAILQEYLPPQLSEEEVRLLAREAIQAGATNLGTVMGKIMPAIKGRFDGREANRVVREELDSAR